MISKENKCKQFLLSALNEGIFSGAAVGFSEILPSGKYRKILEYTGHTEATEKKYSVHKDVFFDLASLTKPLVTSLCFLNLINEGVVDWKEKIGSLLSRTIPEDKRDINLFQLITHSSGLPAYRDYYKQLEKIDHIEAKKRIVDSVLNDPLEYESGTKSVYSDLGYILLGDIVELKTGCPLDLFWEEKICRPLNLQNKLFFPKKGELNIYNCAATSVDPLTSQPVSGVVNDDNCRVMGGIAGHAGLFGKMEGVLTLCEVLIQQYFDLHEIKAFSNSFFREAISRKSHLPYVCGFDTPSPQHSTAGKYISSNSIGHLGFTGTSFWIDLEKKITVVVLTNRIFKRTSVEKMKTFRRTLHDILLESF